VKADELRRLHKAPPILVLPNAWDAASARVFEAEGFRAIATTSAGVAAALGYPDGAVVPPREMVEAVARIARAVRVPVTADIEHAYATTPSEAAEIVLRTIAAGAAGVNIEDVLPGADHLLPVAVQADKIAAVAKAARTSGVPVVINARTDGVLRSFGDPARRIDEAIERGRAYLAAGADCVFVPGAVDREEIAALVNGIGGPLNVLATAQTPPVAELEALGVARLSVGSGPMRAALALVRDIARELHGAGTYTAFTRHALPYDELNELMKPV
jgi:2-methylisocitrate lyase-like PEP mutase family enzyme